MSTEHSESIVILCLNNNIYFNIAFTIILIICLQQVITYMHTIEQVIYYYIMDC